MGGLSTAQAPLHSLGVLCKNQGSVVPKVHTALLHTGAAGEQAGNFSLLLSRLQPGLTFTFCRQLTVGCAGRQGDLSVNGRHPALLCAFLVRQVVSRAGSRAGFRSLHHVYSCLYSGCSNTGVCHLCISTLIACTVLQRHAKDTAAPQRRAGNLPVQSREL